MNVDARVREEEKKGGRKYIYRQSVTAERLSLATLATATNRTRRNIHSVSQEQYPRASETHIAPVRCHCNANVLRLDGVALINEFEKYRGRKS